MPITNSDIKLYMTGSDPAISQVISSQSIGGYPSTTLVYPETFLTYTVGMYGVILPGATTNSGYASVDSELMRVSTTTAELILERSVNSQRGPHLVGAPIYAADATFFNNDFSETFKQYRCVAVKNTGEANDIAYSMGVFLKRGSSNTHSSVRIAVEMPLTDYVSERTATGGASISLTDTTLSGDYEDNQFAGARLTLTSGLNINQSVIIASYDKTLKQFVFTSSLPYSVSAEDKYVIEPCPAQRVSTGIVSPVSGTSFVSDFRTPGLYDPIPINVSGDRINGNDLHPSDVFYVWIERTLDKNSEAFPANTFCLSFTYLTSI